MKNGQPQKNRTQNLTSLTLEDMRDPRMTAQIEAELAERNRRMESGE